MGVIYAFLLGIFEFFRGGKNSQYNQSPFGDNKESFLSYFYNLMSDFNFFSFFIVLFLCMFIGFMFEDNVFKRRKANLKKKIIISPESTNEEMMQEEYFKKCSKYYYTLLLSVVISIFMIFILFVTACNPEYAIEYSNLNQINTILFIFLSLFFLLIMYLYKLLMSGRWYWREIFLIYTILGLLGFYYEGVSEIMLENILMVFQIIILFLIYVSPLKRYYIKTISSSKNQL